MEIKRDDRVWDIVIVRCSDRCEFLSYPANYRACNYQSVEHPGETPCNMDICPIKKYM